LNGQVSCAAENCAYNSKGNCSASNISVNGGNATSGHETFCKTFTMNNSSPSFQNNVSFSSDPNTQIACSAQNCLYYDNQVCNAPNVSIMSSLSTSPIQTECQTFIPRH